MAKRGIRLKVKAVPGALAVPPRSVRIVSGGSSPRKVVEVSGISAEEARRRLSSSTS